MKKRVYILASLVAAFCTSAHAAGISYSDCRQFDEDELSADTNDPKQIASAYLVGAVERDGIDTPSTAEIQNRDACVTLSLQNGADPNTSLGFQAPLLSAITNGDTAAALALLMYKANPNVQDTAVMGTGGISVLHRACEQSNDQVIQALLNAGADPVVNDPLWTSAANADDVAVAALIKTGKIPVSQLENFGDQEDVFNDAQTALDASEERVAEIASFFKKYPVTATSRSEKLDEKRGMINDDILYAYYPLFPQVSATQNPEDYMVQLQTKQQHVSSILKAAGWKCHQDNCGIDDIVDADPGN